MNKANSDSEGVKFFFSIFGTMSFRSPIHERFFVIKTNRKIEEFRNFEDCNIQNDTLWIVHDKFEKFYTKIQGYEWRISKFSFYKNFPIQCKLSCNDWDVEDIDIKRITLNYVAFTVTFSDPLKRIKRFDFSIDKSGSYLDPNANDLQVVIRILDKLNEFSQFRNWEQITLSEENRRLQEETFRLKKQFEG